MCVGLPVKTKIHARPHQALDGSDNGMVSSDIPELDSELEQCYDVDDTKTRIHRLVETFCKQSSYLTYLEHFLNAVYFCLSHKARG